MNLLGFFPLTPLKYRGNPIKAHRLVLLPALELLEASVRLLNFARILLPLALCVMVVPFASATDDQNQSIDAATVRALMDRVAQLEAEVKELKAANQRGAEAKSSTAVAQDNAAGPSAPANATVSVASLEHGDHGAIVHPTAPTASSETYPSLHLRGFADVTFNSTDRPGAKSGFNMGQFVLHVASPLSRQISYFGEVSLTAQPTGYNVDLERSFIRYSPNDYLGLSFGRYHTPANYWNTEFHHGAWLQTTISRPDMIQFGGRLIPVHFIGGLAEGRIPSGPMGLNYGIGIGNGRGNPISRGGDAGDINNNRAWVLNIFSRPLFARGLQFGGSMYRDQIPTATTNIPHAEWIAAGHLVYTPGAPEFIAEFANVHHRNMTSAAEYDSQGGYVQVAYRLPFGDKKWKPYYRYDYIQVPGNEPIFTAFKNQRNSTLGMRYDISDFAALKAEYRNSSPDPGKPRVNGAFFQTAFTF